MIQKVTFYVWGVGILFIHGVMLCNRDEQHAPMSFVDIQRMYVAPQEQAVPLVLKNGVKQLSNAEQRSIVTDIFEKQLHRYAVQAVDSDLPRLLQDLNVFSLQTNDSQYRSRSLFSHIKRTTTVSGESVLAHIVANPVADAVQIEQRQRIVQGFLDTHVAERCDTMLRAFKDHESGVLFSFKNKDIFEEDRIRSLFFSSKCLSRLNDNEHALMCIPICDVLKIVFGSSFYVGLYWLGPKFLHTTYGKLFLKNIMIDKILSNLGIVDALQKDVNAAKQVLHEKQSQEAADKLEEAEASLAAFKSFFTEKDIGLENILGIFPRISLGSVLMSYVNPVPHIQAIKNINKLESSTSKLLSGYKGWSYISHLFTVHQNYKTYQEATVKVSCYVHQQLTHVAAMVKTFENLTDLVRQSPDMSLLYAEWQKTAGSSKGDVEFEKLISLLKTSTFSGEVSYIAHQGRVRAAYCLVQKHKERIVDMIRFIGMVDAHRSIAKLYAEHQKTNNKYTFAGIIDHDQPVIQAQDFWNPLLAAETAVPNSIVLSGDVQLAPRAAVITGANSGGKSTIMVNGLGTAHLLASTLGIVPAKSYTATLVDCMMTSLKLQDNSATGESHFMTEARMAAQMLKKAQSVSKAGKKMLLVVDELFEGTDSETGSVSLREVVERIAKYNNLISVVVTQHKELSGPVSLEKQYPGIVKNYKVDVQLSRDENNKIVIKRVHELEDGYSEQKIGSTLLQETLQKHGVA